MFQSLCFGDRTPTFVTPGLDPGVHRIKNFDTKKMDCRVNPRIKSGDGNDD